LLKVTPSSKQKKNKKLSYDVRINALK